VQILNATKLFKQIIKNKSTAVINVQTFAQKAGCKIRNPANKVLISGVRNFIGPVIEKRGDYEFIFLSIRIWIKIV